ncbi:MAG: hypothetical protein H6835_07255 [Planctomycetes bacterium]|nr:hypothetical protein [Planctomycetota bacterium]
MTRHTPATLLALATALSTASAQSLLQQYGENVQGSNETVAAGVTVAASAATSVPVMDLDGNIVWRAKLAGASITTANDYALFYGRNGNDLTMLFQEGDADPSGTYGNATASGSQWDNHRLSPENDFLVWGTSLVQDGATIVSTNDTLVYWGQVGSAPLILIQEGTTVMPSGGAVASGTQSAAPGQFVMNSTGTAIFKATFAGGDVGVFNGISTWGNDALLVGTPGNLSWVCREGDLINGGQQAIGNLTFFGSSSPVTIDDQGRSVFAQALSTTEGLSPATSNDDATLLLYTPGSGLSLLIREGDAAADTNPPLGEGNLYGTLNLPRASLSRHNGHVLFLSNMTGGNVTGANDDIGIFAGQIGGGFTRVARESEAAPTGVSGETYSAFFTNGSQSINDNGTVIFVAQLGNAASTASDVAIFRAVPPYGPGDVTMILREGDAVAGLPVGWTVSNTNGGGMGSSSTHPLLNDREMVLVNVAGVGDPTQANWGTPGTICWDPEHGARAFYVQGDTFTVNGNVWATSSAAGFNGSNSYASGDGCMMQFNNNGDVCLKMFSGSENAVVRGHVGSMICEPASVPAAGGVAHDFHIDCGPAHANEFYLVIASGAGTRPGFLNPLNPSLHVPLNPDFWLGATIELPNSTIWQNSFWLTDANGAGSASFQLPAGLPGALGLGLHHAAALFDLSLTGTFVTEPSKVRHY